MKKIEAFLVFNVPPGEKKFNYWPQWMDENGVLWMANLNGRINGRTKPTVFKSKGEAQAAIHATKMYILKNKLHMWNNEFVIQPISI